jgi:flavin-dependent dehydrogenase
MLLARKGYKVLVVDRATFPSDTVSTHLSHPPAIAALKRWGVLDGLEATGVPPINKYSFDFGPITISGTPRPADGVSTAYSPRRTVLDKLLVDAAAEAGAEIREGFTASEILVENGRVTGVRGHGRGGHFVTERARVVIGGDGRHSLVAKAVRPKQYNEKQMLECGYYAYWSDLHVDGVEVTIRPDRGWGAFPTHDGLTCLVVGWPYSEFEANRADVEGNYMKALELSPSFAERVRGARRETRFAGAPIENFFRKPFGPGWALVGDAGYNKDPITAQGVSDAFRDAELCATALDETFTGTRSYADAMTDYHRTRDEHVLPMYEFTCQLATLEPPPPEMQQLLGAVYGNQEAMNDFVSITAGTVSPAQFFSDENVGRIMAGAGSAVAAN